MSYDTPLPFDTRRATAPVPSLAPAGHGDTFLLAAFREFYRELLRAKRRVQRGEWPAVERADDTDPGSPAEAGGHGAVWQDLLTLLERQALDAARSGGDIGRELYLQEQYAMASLADETFL